MSNESILLSELPNVSLKVIKSSPNIHSLVMQVATSPDQENSQELWQISEKADSITNTGTELSLRNLYKSLCHEFNLSLFTRIEWCLGAWTEGAVSLAKGQHLIIVSGNPYLLHQQEEVSHIVKHELLHYFFRQILSSDLHGSPAEEALVQFHSRWELSQEILHKNIHFLEESRLATQKRDWTKLNTLVSQLRS